MGRKKIEKDQKMVPVTIRLTPDHIKHLRKLCIDMASRDQKIYNIGYLIRETLLQAYPMPKNKQLDLFA